MKKDITGLIFFILIIAFFIFIVFCLIRVIALPIPDDNFCKIKYGEGFVGKDTFGSESKCISVNYSTGDAAIKYYLIKDLHEVCPMPKFFDLKVWSWDCEEAGLR